MDKIKYLGIIIDSKFKFNEHIKYITDRCTKLINAFSKSARLNWGLKHEALCILTGLTPIDIKVEEVAKLYNITKGRTNQNHHIDKAENPRNWLHPADIASVNDKKDDSM